MPVIAMTREMGSLGKDVATGLARDLGLKLVYHEIVDSLAHKLHLGESEVLRLIQGNAGLVERWRTNLDALSLYTAEEVFALGAAGNVIIRGWGATHLLRAVSHVLCIRVCAPFELRVRRIMERLSLDDFDLAATEVRRNDAAHAAAMLRRFHIDWQEAERYDLVLNTEQVTVEHCIAQIKRLLELPQFQPAAVSRARLEQLALSAHVLAALKLDPVTSGVRISVEPSMNGSEGCVKLSGIVLDEDQKRSVEAVASRLPGVRAVENQLRTMRPRHGPISFDG